MSTSIKILSSNKQRNRLAATEAVAGALPGMLDGMMPEMPELPGATGGAIPTPSSSNGSGGGLMIPKF